MAPCHACPCYAYPQAMHATFAMHAPLHHPPSLWTEGMIHTCENITFPQLLFWALCVNEASTGPIRRPYLKEQRHCASRINNRWSTHIMYVTSCASNMSNAKNKTFLLIDCVKINLVQGFLGVSLMAYLHWPGPRQGQDRKQIMGCMKLYGRFRITPEPGQGSKPIVPHCPGPSSCFYLGPSST